LNASRVYIGVNSIDSTKAATEIAPSRVSETISLAWIKSVVGKAIITLDCTIH
jgi:hypothetical protein